MRVGAPFDPRSLFAQGERGVYWSAAHPSLVFADVTAETPAQFGQSIARVDYISPNGWNAVQPSTALRPLLGRAPLAGRRNLLVRTEELNHSAWSRTGATVADQGGGGWLVSDNSSSGRHGVKQSLSIAETYLRSLEVKAGTANRIFVSPQTSGTRNLASFNLSTGQVSVNDADGVNASADLVDIGDGWWRLSYRADGGNFFVGFSESDATAGTANAQNQSHTGDGSRNFLVRFPQATIIAGLEPLAYQRVGNALDVTESGMASYPLLRFDLSDDVLPTAFPDGGTFDVMLFGRQGNWIERDVTIAQGGSFNIGPITITGGPAGLLEDVGDVVGWLALDRSLTDPEITRLIQFHKRFGADDLLEANG